MLNRSKLRIAWIVALAGLGLAFVLWPVLALATDHYVFGLQAEPGTSHEIRQNGNVIEVRPSAPNHVFRSDGGGQFEIRPVVTVPPNECPELSAPLDRIQAAAPCGINQEWWVRFEVKNTGTAPAGTFSTRVSLTPPGGARSTKCTLETNALAVGASEALGCRLANSTPTSPAGNWIVTIEVDVTDRVGESDETNNVVTR